MGYQQLSANPHPPGPPTSSLVSLEADLARAGLGFSEAALARASRLFSWQREDRCGVVGGGLGKS